LRQPRKLIFGMPPYFDPTRTSQKKTKKLLKNEKGKTTSKKMKWKTTSILRQPYWAYLTTKTSKRNGFDTIEIDLVKDTITLIQVSLWC
jgi:hypothetical protein